MQSIATGIERGSISEIPPVQKFVLEPPSPGRQPQNSLSTLHAVGAHSGGWGRVWGRGRARAAAQTLSGPPRALRGPFLARPRPARPPRARLASLRCGAPLQPLGERPEGGGKRRGRVCGLCGAKRYQTDVLGQARCATRLARAPCTPKRVSPTGACASHPAALAASEPLVLRASWGARLGARTYGVRTARLRTFLGAPLACLDTRCGVCATCQFRARLAPQQLPGGSCGAGQWLEKSFEACAAGLPM